MVLATALLLTLVSGCKKSEGPTPPAKPQVALVMKSLANEFFGTMAEGAKAHQAANAAKYDLIVNGIKNETDLAEQVNLVDQMIARRVKAIVIAPADSRALVTVLKRAKDASILVINIDNKKWEKDFSPIDEGLDCDTSQYYSKAYVRHLFKSGEILGLTIASIQNLAFYLWLVKEARKRILEGKFINWKNEMIPILKTRL